MQYFNLENLIGLVFILLVAYGCIHLKTTPTSKLSTRIAIIILGVDEINQDLNTREIAIKSIDKAVSFVKEVEDGQFDVNVALNVLETLDIGGGKTLKDSIGPSGRMALRLAVEDAYIDLSKAGKYLPKEINTAFATKFIHVLITTRDKLKG
jgi:hypothetical protein